MPAKQVSPCSPGDSLYHFLQKHPSALLLLVITALLVLLFALYRSRTRKKLHMLAYMDSTTALPSFQKFLIDVRVRLRTAKPGEYMLAAMDIDKFKYINDSLGYACGDQLLRSLGDLLHSCCDDSTLIARQSADCFVFFFKTCPRDTWLQEENHARFDSLICKELGGSFSITCSIGVYTISDPRMNISSMIDCAKIAKKQVKSVYGIAAAEFTEEMKRDLEGRRSITLNMQRALRELEFVPYLQSKIALASGQVSGAEILVRWILPDGSMIYPDSFIPVFEKNGFIVELDMYMFEKACQMIARWRKKFGADLPILSVNLSKVTAGRLDLPERFLFMTQKYGICPAFIEIEMTESALMENAERIMQNIGALKRAGFQISIDDFGSGYSSLSMLKDFPADVLKMDRAFLSETINSSNGKEIIESVIRMSKRLNMRTVAEGVETLEQAEILRELGCDNAQGYYYMQPADSVSFERLMDEVLPQNALPLSV